MGNWVSLQRHPASPTGDVTGIEGTVHRSLAGLSCRLRVYGDIRRLDLPELVHPADRRRRDGLWQSTCLEAFAAVAGNGRYAEFNLSPEGHWAAYQFDGKRQGMRDLETTVRLDQAYRDEHVFDMSATFRTGELPAEAAWQVGLSMVVAGLDGTKSYWALAHPEGPPDFHNPECFVLTLPAP